VVSRDHTESCKKEVDRGGAVVRYVVMPRVGSWIDPIMLSQSLTLIPCDLPVRFIWISSNSMVNMYDKIDVPTAATGSYSI